MNPAARVRRRLVVGPKPKTIKDYVYEPIDFCLPSYLWMPRDIVNMHMRLAEDAYAVIESLRFLDHLRSQRFIAMCPENHGPIYDKHVFSIHKILSWKEEIKPLDPTLIPAAKIPYDTVGLRVDQKAYDGFAKHYINTLQKFYSVEWPIFCQRMFDMKHAASRQMEHFDYMAWLYWWKTEFKPAMEKWQVYMDDLSLPSYEDTVDDLYDLLVERVETTPEMTALKLVQGNCSCMTKLE